MLVVPARRITRLRVTRALVYIDESGRFQPALPGRPPERPLLASVMFHDVEANRARIAAVVNLLRTRHGPRVKAAKLDEADYALICGLVRDVGYLGHSGVEYAHENEYPSACVDLLDGLHADLERAGSRTSRALEVRAAIERTRTQLLRVDSPNLAAYLVQLVFLLRRTAEWFRAAGIVPDLRLTVDERLRSDDVDLVRFLPRLAVSTVFPELFETRLSALWSDTSENTAVVSTDDACDGLVLADAIAYAYGHVARGTDRDGFYAAQIESCRRLAD